MSGQSDDSMRAELRERATRQVERALTLGKLSEAEQLAVSDTEIEDEIKTMLLSFGAEAGLVQQFLSAPEMRRRIASRLLAEKTVERLVLIARGEAPEIGADAAEETAPEEPETALRPSETADGTAPEPGPGPEAPAAEQHNNANRD
jgi:FKBP-type peptidyl-prolyl cis-trans isomerase (trigger factor)